jgi:hypothetical protein
MLCITCNKKETKGKGDFNCEECKYRSQLEQAFIEQGYITCELFDLERTKFEDRTEDQNDRIHELETIRNDLDDAVSAIYSIWDMHRKGQKPIPLEEVKKNIGWEDK